MTFSEFTGGYTYLNGNTYSATNNPDSGSGILCTWEWDDLSLLGGITYSASWQVAVNDGQGGKVLDNFESGACEPDLNEYAEQLGGPERANVS